jgi:hypothetical protein
LRGAHGAQNRDVAAKPETILSAATSTIKVRIKNITLRSTWSALKNVALRWRQSTM